MSKQKTKTKTKSKLNESTLIKNDIPSWLETFTFIDPLKNKTKVFKSIEGQGFVYILGPEESFLPWIDQHALSYQKEELLNSKKDHIHFTGVYGPVWIIKIKKDPGPQSHGGHFVDSEYTQSRDGVGCLVSIFKHFNLKQIHVEFINTSEEAEVGAFVGLELGAYNFKSLFDGSFQLKTWPQVIVSGSSVDFLKDAQEISMAVNWSRHWTNLPPNILNPKTMEESLKKLFSKFKTVEVEVWNTQRLQKENMGLHLAVGNGALHGPRMVILKYRPQKNKKTKLDPFVFVGKGITFDTGGLDLKPSSAMRLMKKDMGGAATVAGLCYWVAQAQYEHPCDFYIGLAENSVSENSMRPGDIYQSKSGLQIEIHNTDAEGRLVLADVITAALEQLKSQKLNPKCLIDVATLTGAIKVALGADLAGLFSNHDGFAETMLNAGQRTGDLSWRMPLVSKYAPQMNSSVAALTNAVDGFGGAITAALFLEKFVDQVPWIHLDIYAWADKPHGALTTSGGSGQAVQSLIGFLSLHSN